MTYYVTGTGTDFWIKTGAKTLNGAKAIASKKFQQSVGGKISVGEKFNEGEGVEFEQIIPMAVKHGYEKWSNLG